MNKNDMIDLRSDTVTKPTNQMKEAMIQASVGDDVYGEDPSVNKLERKVSDLLKKEAALFVPTGTMANQIAIGSLTSPGDEILCDSSYHINKWEAGGPARLWGVSTGQIQSPDYILRQESLKNYIKPDDNHYVKTRLVCLENSLNWGGGKVFPFIEMEKIFKWSREVNLSVHIDGARLWNASAASKIELHKWATLADSVSLCFSKGMGAPVGSILVGSRPIIERARRLRKLLGGGMRQSGMLAAACTYSIDHHFQRLEEDHKRAKTLAKGFSQLPGLRLEFSDTETNIVWLRVQKGEAEAKRISNWFRENGVLISQMSDLLRLVLHLDIGDTDIDKTLNLLNRFPSS